MFTNLAVKIFKVVGSLNLQEMCNRRLQVDLARFLEVKMNCDQDGIQGTLYCVRISSESNHCLYDLVFKFFTEILVVTLT